MNATTNSCTCLDSPNMLYAPCQACSGEDFETGEIVQVSNCTFIGGSTDDDVVVKFDSSPFEYCLPGSAIRRIPPAQAEPVAVCECGKQYAKIDEVTYCPDCTTAMTGLTEAELRQALAEPVEAKEPWKPKKGEKMYAIVEFDGISASGDAHILVQYGDDHRELTSCGISQLRPLASGNRQLCSPCTTGSEPAEEGGVCTKCGAYATSEGDKPCE